MLNLAIYHIWCYVQAFFQTCLNLSLKKPESIKLAINFFTFSFSQVKGFKLLIVPKYTFGIFNITNVTDNLQLNNYNMGSITKVNFIGSGTIRYG